MSAAEKQRRYRARRDADEQRRQQYLEKEKEKWRKDVETGKKKKQKDRSVRAQRAQRKRWKEAHKRSNARKKVLEGLNTPPVSPDPPASPEIRVRPESPVSSQPGTSRSGHKFRLLRNASECKQRSELYLYNEQ